MGAARWARALLAVQPLASHPQFSAVPAGVCPAQVIADDIDCDVLFTYSDCDDPIADNPHLSFVGGLVVGSTLLKDLCPVSCATVGCRSLFRSLFAHFSHTFSLSVCSRCARFLAQCEISPEHQRFRNGCARNTTGGCKKLGGALQRTFGGHLSPSFFCSFLPQFYLIVASLLLPFAACAVAAPWTESREIFDRICLNNDFAAEPRFGGQYYSSAGAAPSRNGAFHCSCCGAPLCKFTHIHPGRRHPCL